MNHVITKTSYHKTPVSLKQYNQHTYGTDFIFKSKSQQLWKNVVKRLECNKPMANYYKFAICQFKWQILIEELMKISNQKTICLHLCSISVVHLPALPYPTHTPFSFFECETAACSNHIKYKCLLKLDKELRFWLTNQ